MNDFAKILNNLGDFTQLCDMLNRDKSPVLAVGLSHIHKAHFVYSAVTNLNTDGLLITADEPSAIRLTEDINAFFGENLAMYYPSRDFTFRDVEGVSREYEHARLKVLEAMSSSACKLTVASIEASLQYTIPPEVLKERTFIIRIGETYQLSEILHRLIKAGYERREQVDGVCQFSQRGGILDFFPPHSPDPYRIEFWGDDIDSIASFKVDTQRRTENHDCAVITPAREVIAESGEALAKALADTLGSLKGKAQSLAKEHIEHDVKRLTDGLMLSNIDKYLPIIYKKPATLFDYTNGVIFVSDLTACKESYKTYLWQVLEDIKIMLTEGIIFKGCDTFSADFIDFTSILTKQKTMLMDTFARTGVDVPLKALYNINAVQLSSWGGEYTFLKEDLDGYIYRGYTTIIMAGTKRGGLALCNDLVRDGINAEFVEDISTLIGGKVYITEGSLSGGFEYPEIKLAVITHNKTASLSTKKKKHIKKADQIKSLSDLTVGDYVVHVAHGIGVFEGIIKREIHGIVKDYIKIRYAGTDTLFVPVTQLDLVSKYIGKGEDTGIRLNKLNSIEWTKTRARVKKAVADMAEELIKLYSERMQVKGFAFSEDNEWQKDFEERFPYEETDDQLRCIEEIKHDMQEIVPMDRLLCGDVGFGKTEVAIRAVFKCIMDSKQCAVLVPTTILAWQHFQTFKQRMAGFPIRVELLSRFVSPKEQEEIIKDVRKGLVDVVIGTHRLIQKDIKFKDLGLCIIDEEQRFGVAHKEKFKEMRSTVDVLTLSATPIPRTLNMAMSGIRDMSIIEEAPQDRHPVQTYVLEHDMGVLAEAMRKEIRRGGQVFYLHNRVESIDSCAYRINQMLPDARIVVAHGKMNEEQLSRVWKKLVEHEIDILVCTTIIETGVDVSNCNTLIIEDADRMGLSQLYQLRGRVGRGNRRAFAYLTFTRGKSLTDIATKRLAAIREFTSFGSGFRIAMRDLEIRGAGNILGAQQHGHMEAVGYDMYLKMLSDAVLEGRGEAVDKSSLECMIDIRIGAHIPEEYIENLAQRIDIYKKIAAIQNNEDALDIIDELIDRFGDPPTAVKGLVDVALIRNMAASYGIREISEKNDAIILYPEQIDMVLASSLAVGLKGRVMLSAGAKPYITVKMKKGQGSLDTIREVLDTITTAKNNTDEQMNS